MAEKPRLTHNFVNRFMDGNSAPLEKRFIVRSESMRHKLFLQLLNSTPVMRIESGIRKTSSPSDPRRGDRIKIS